MKSTRFLLPLVTLACATPLTAFADGVLAVNVAPFKTEVKLTKKVQSQLEGGGIEWGVANNRLVVTLVNKQFVGPVIDHLTRFGTSTSLPLPAGEYHTSCIGMIYQGGLSVEKVLSKGGYFNVDVMTFRIEDGKTTTLEVHPVMKASSGMLLKMFAPELFATATLETEISPEVSLNVRNDKSVAWDDYSGDLKFKK